MNPIEQLKELATLIKKIGDIELYTKIVEFQTEVVKLSSRNAELEQKCLKLEAELRLKKSLSHVRSLYFADDDPMPFCPYCWETSEKLVHLFGPEALMLPGGERWKCHACNNDYTGQSGKNFKASPSRIRGRI
jgi:transposase-like protein